MRYFLFSTILFFSISSSATHIIGGNITWECNGSGQYIFSLNLYRDCSPPGMLVPPSMGISGPFGLIPVQRDTIIDVSLRCNGSSSLRCDGPVNTQKGVELHIYKSSPVTFATAPPQSGWKFFFTACCRSSALVNSPIAGPGSPVTRGGIFIRSYMYPSKSGKCNSSPYFDFNPAQQIISTTNSLSTLGQSTNTSDSLYYDFESPGEASNIPVTFLPGFTKDSPFPNPATNAVNGPVSINHTNGLIDFDIKTGSKGLYNYAVGIEQWRRDTILSKIIVDNSVLGDFDSLVNSPPTVSIDTAIYGLSRLANIYTIEALPGDTIEFVIEAVDLDIDTSTSLPQNILFKASGIALDSVWNNGNVFSQDAILSPVVPQSGFVSNISNKVRFKWIVGSEHYSGPKSNHVFHFMLTDDNCPIVGVSNIIVEVNVKAVSYITRDTVFVCQGDSVQLRGFSLSNSYLWSPSTAISSTNVNNPTVWPGVSGYYYLTDPQNPGFIDSVYIDVTPKATFHLAFTGGKLVLTDSAQTTTRKWFYNGVPFNYPYDTLTPFGLGDYYVVAQSGNCQYNSGVVRISSGMSFSVTAPNNGGYAGAPAIATGSLGITFQVNQNVNVSWISIPGISDVHGKTGGYDLNLKVYDNTQTEIFTTDVTITRPIDNVLKVPVNLNLMTNQDYTVVVSGDTGYAFSLYVNIQLPATPHNVGFTVKALFEGAARQYPTTPVTYALPISLGIDKTVSLAEVNNNSWSIYPNPAKQQIQITGLDGARTLELVDVNGKVVKSIAIEKNQIDITLRRDNISSGLYFIKVQFENSTSAKKVLFE